MRGVGPGTQTDYAGVLGGGRSKARGSRLVHEIRQPTLRIRHFLPRSDKIFGRGFRRRYRGKTPPHHNPQFLFQQNQGRIPLRKDGAILPV